MRHPTQNGKWQSCHAQPNPIRVCVCLGPKQQSIHNNNRLLLLLPTIYDDDDDFACAIKRQSFAIGSDLLGIGNNLLYAHCTQKAVRIAESESEGRERKIYRQQAFCCLSRLFCLSSSLVCLRSSQFLPSFPFIRFCILGPCVLCVWERNVQHLCNNWKGERNEN